MSLHIVDRLRVDTRKKQHPPVPAGQAQRNMEVFSGSIKHRFI
jgi:hypothetical protein